jgi:hypothetical protein
LPAHKIAISLPPEVVIAVDRAARDRGVPRSRFIADVLRIAAQAKRDADITRRLDALFADGRALDEQREESERYLQARPRRRGGW